MENFQALEKEVYGIMEKELPKHLTYHSIDHTKHVVRRSEYIARAEGCSEAEIRLLKTAALFHDIGFIHTYRDHEEKGCEIVREELPSKGYSNEQIDTICGMIMATKIPQNPQNNLEKIIADADLEYLGTDDFEEIGDLLFKELRHFNPELSRDDWNEIQIKFLKAHHYHTEFCRENRQGRKLENLDSLK
ncbi:HD domain-containing protein [bacterium]|nr:HD domain-containing protein [bacterium]